MRLGWSQTQAIKVSIRYADLIIVNCFPSMIILTVSPCLICRRDANVFGTGIASESPDDITLVVCSSINEPSELDLKR